MPKTEINAPDQTARLLGEKDADAGAIVLNALRELLGTDNRG